MKNRFHLDASYESGETLELTGAECHHAVKVARVRVGEEIELFDGRGNAAAATVRSIDAGRAVVVVESVDVPSRESPFRLVLAMSLIHLDRFELVLQKATELGAHRIIPLIADRSEVRLERIRGRGDRWARIIVEAVKQSGRSRVPELAEPRPLEEVLEGEGPFVLFDGEEPETGVLSKVSGATLLIGPEGGWSEREIALARERGASLRRLGPRRLRAETAAIAALITIGSECGDLPA